AFSNVELPALGRPIMVMKPERKDISRSASSAGNLRPRLLLSQSGGQWLAALPDAAHLLQQLRPSSEFYRPVRLPNPRQWPLHDVRDVRRATPQGGLHPCFPAPDTSPQFRESPALVRARH